MTLNEGNGGVLKGEGVKSIRGRRKEGYIGFGVTAGEN